MKRITGTLHEDQCTFMVTSRSVLVRMKNVSDDSCRENQNKFYVQENIHENLVVFWDNVEKFGRARQATDDMRTACWITKATNVLRKCNIYCFSTASMVTRTRLDVTFISTLPLLFSPALPQLRFLVFFKDLLFLKNSLILLDLIVFLRLILHSCISIYQSKTYLSVTEWHETHIIKLWWFDVFLTVHHSIDFFKSPA